MRVQDLMSWKIKLPLISRVPNRQMIFQVKLDRRTKIKSRMCPYNPLLTPLKDLRQWLVNPFS